MRPFLAIVQVTLRQLTGRKRVIGFTLLSLAPAGIFYLAARTGGMGDLERGFATILVAPFFSIVLPIVTLVLAASALGDERKDKTLSFLVLRPVRRLDIAAGKTVAAALVASAFAAVGAAGIALAYGSVGGEVAVLGGSIAGAVIAAVMYAGLFVLLGYAVARPTLVGLLYVLLVDNTLIALLPRLSSFSGWRVGFAATVDLIPNTFRDVGEGAVGSIEPSVSGSLVQALLTVAVTVAVCAIILRRSDNV